MARAPRIEVEGGLYHVITRGVDRRDIFHDPDDHGKFSALLRAQKGKLPFFLYAYCLMTNHLHLLIERRTDDIGRIMHRVLTGYCQYYNRRYGRSGHLLQGRHKAILCQSDRYLTRLVRYIHLNPVRARMVAAPEEYPFSSHRAYLGSEPAGITDVDPVLRGFAAKKARARELFAQFVRDGATLGPQDDLYQTDNGILGSDDFVDEMIHRIGRHDTALAVERRRAKAEMKPFRPENLIAAVGAVCGATHDDFRGAGKTAHRIFLKDACILAGYTVGASATDLSRLLGVSTATISRRRDSARLAEQENAELAATVKRTVAQYQKISREENRKS